MRVVLLLLITCFAASAAFAQAPGAEVPSQQSFLPLVSTSSPGRIAYVNDNTAGWSVHVVNGDGSGDRAITEYPLTTPQHPSWSPDGKKLAFDAPGQTTAMAQIYLIQDDGSNVQQITQAPGGASDPAWSPDGSRIAFVSGQDIYVMHTNGSDQIRLTDHPAADLEPAWSPDGSRIVFTSLRDGNEDIYTMLADGTNVTRLTTDLAADTSPVWSPDGQRIAFCSQRGGAPGMFMPADLYLMHSNGSGVSQLTNTNQYVECAPAWSPDGSRIAFTRGTFPPQPTASTIYSIGADGTGDSYLAGAWRYNSSPAWTR